MKLIYISGSISTGAGGNVSPVKMQENLARFHEMEKKLTKAGHEVFNPASLEQKGWTWEQYLARDLKYIYDRHPMMYMMKGWSDSRGARLEWEFAKLLHLTILYEE